MNTQNEELPDFYELLECTDAAKEKELQRAFRKQAFKYHPDKNPTQEAAARFHLLTIALDTLTNAEKRQKYDAIRQQKVDALRRRERIEGERRAWIDELEKGETAASMSEHDRKRKRQEQETREEELSRTGAKMRADLAHNLRAKHSESLKEPLKSPLTPKNGGHETEISEVSEIVSARDKTLKVRFRGQTNETKLRSVFSRFGELKEIVYRPSDKKTQSALLEYAQIHSAYAASTSSFRGQSDLDVREISWAYGNIPKLCTLDVEDQQQGKGSDPDVTSFSSAANVSTKPSRKTFSFNGTKPPEGRPRYQAGSEYESLILLRMKQRQKEKEASEAKAYSQA